MANERLQRDRSFYAVHCPRFEDSLPLPSRAPEVAEEAAAEGEEPLQIRGVGCWIRGTTTTTITTTKRHANKQQQR